MRNIRIHSFREDILKVSLTYICDGTALIYPSREAAKTARKAYQSDWKLERVGFYSIEELGESMLAEGKPLLADDKRVLCLYLSLSQEDKDYFHLNGYKGCVSWAASFFDLFEEMAEEQVPISRISKLNEEGLLYLQVWQEEFWQRILEIRKRFRSQAEELGFSDKIFLSGESIDHNPFQYQRYVFVNQFYYSALEKQMISSLEASGADVIILFQGEGEWFDPDGLRIRTIDFDRIMQERNFCNRQITIHQSKTMDGMILDFLRNYSQLAVEAEQPGKDEPGIRRALIDHKFFQQPYRIFFDGSDFALPEREPVTSQPLYQFLHILTVHLEAVIPAEGILYLPLHHLLSACADDWFVEYFSLEECSPSVIRDQLFVLMENSYLYVDSTLMLFDEIRHREDFADLKAWLGHYFALLLKCSGIGSLKELCGLFDQNGSGLEASSIATGRLLGNGFDQKRFYTDFYGRLANLAAIEELGIVSCWEDIFPAKAKEQRAESGEQRAESLSAKAAGLFRLCLQAIKNIQLRQDCERDGRPVYQISNLLDSRDLSYDEICFLSLIEGELPGRMRPVWLFNETQKQKLGLKHRDIIRNWERYYFFRLLLCSGKADLYTYRDVEKEIEPSSFLGEIMSYARNGWLNVCNTDISAPDIPVSLLFGRRDIPKMLALPGLADPNICGIQKKGTADSTAKSYQTQNGNPEEPTDKTQDKTGQSFPTPIGNPEEPWRFFALPFSLEEDFPPDPETGKRAFNITHYNLETFLSNPFIWYLSRHCDISPRPYNEAEAISRKFFGDILHSFISRIFQLYLEKHRDRIVKDSELLLEPNLKDIFFKLLQTREMKYKIPRNYNRTFLFEIMADGLVDCVRWFFSRCLPELLKGIKTPVNILPEQTSQRPEEKNFKELIAASENAFGLPVKIKGRIDLRLETDAMAFLIDFKTGKGNLSNKPEQLILYEYFYYLLDGKYPELMHTLDSRYCKILEQEYPPMNITQEKRNAFLEKIIDRIRDVKEFGYLIPRKATDRKNFAEITRSDLCPLALMPVAAEMDDESYDEEEEL